MDVRIEPSWGAQLKEEFEKPYFEGLTRFVRQEYAAGAIYPPAGKIFAAFDACPFEDVKVVILGQDPYHGPGQANGLCFSVNPGVALPPSLVNILAEAKNNGAAGVDTTNGDLTRWAKQGVLLLNSTLTVRPGQPASHQGHGWEEFTDAAIRALAEKREGLVFMLWGSSAQRKGAFIDRSKHLVLTSPHPSPLSAWRGFMGNGHFAKANEWLQAHGQTPIQW